MSSDDQLSNASGDDDLGSEIDELFGDDGSEAGDRPNRTLDDENLDSGDDLDRHDRMEADSYHSPVVEEDKELNVQQSSIPRHPVPEPGDNELYLLKVPQFLAIDSIMYQPQSFEPPAREHHSKQMPTSKFSAYSTAMTTVRWRHSPNRPSELQSNGRILRWSDGSLTLQMATDPSLQYQISAKDLAPPQAAPPKPVPSMTTTRRKGRNANGGEANGWDASRETFTYLAEPSESSYLVRVTGKFTTSLDIKPDPKMESLDSLAASMDAAREKYKATFANNEDGGAAALIATGGTAMKLEDIRDDPEKSKKEALRQEREQDRKKRKEERDQLKNLGIGRSGAGRSAGGFGLSLGDLEGEGSGRGRGGKGSGARGRNKSRRDELSDEEEEMYGRRGGPEDQYDMEDDFLASDNEDDDESGGSEDAEGEEDIDDVIERQEKERAAQKKGSQPSPKRTRETQEDLHDDEDVRRASPVNRKKRRVVSDDDSD